jgi:hypothetical protein
MHPATVSAALPPDGSAPQAIVSEARVSLDEARKTQSDPRTAVGHYLDAADVSVRSVGLSSGSEVTEEARSIYNAACTFLICAPSNSRIIPEERYSALAPSPGIKHGN